jgi:hypothetical protein
MKTLTFIPLTDRPRKYKVWELDQICSLPVIKPVVEIENYSLGCAHSAHPNIAITGSVRGMKKLGYWRKEDITYKQGGYIFNISNVACSGLLDELCLAIEISDFNLNISSNGIYVYDFNLR